MPAGTIALTNNSATVTGTGTSFTTELKVNDFVVSTVGGVAYTLGVKSIESNTSLTLIEKYTGPSATGQSWTPVPYGTMAAITAQLAAQVTYAIRGLNLDKANWQQVFTGSGNVTVTLPDGTSWQGPSWGFMTNQFSSKMDKSQNLNDVANKATAWNNIAVYGNAANTAAQGNDSRLNTINNKSGGTVSGSLLLSANGASLDFGFAGATSWTHRLIPESDRTMTLASTASYTIFRVAGGYCSKSGYTGAYGTNVYNFNWFSSSTASYMEMWVDGSRIGSVNTTSLSDKALKKDIIYADSEEQRDAALKEVLGWRPATFRFKKRGILPEGREQLGFIANDLVKSSKECVTGKGLPEDFDVEETPNDIDDAYSPDQMAMIAKLTLSVQILSSQVESRDEIISELMKRMKAIDGLDA